MSSVTPRRRRQKNKAYQAELIAQIKENQQVRSEEKAHAEREYQQDLLKQELYNQKKDEILSIPTSHTIEQHPFRRAEGSGSASPLPDVCT